MPVAYLIKFVTSSGSFDLNEKNPLEVTTNHILVLKMYNGYYLYSQILIFVI